VRAAGSGPVVVDTSVFGAELTRRGAAVVDAYQRHIDGHDLIISFITAAELRYGARLARWGAQRLRRLEARLAVAEIVWAGDGLVDEYVSLRHECSVSGSSAGAEAS
jgi:predicted nucleic acid-binding protein